MRPDEVRDAGSLAGTALGEITELARDVHSATAGRLFGLAANNERATQAVAPIRLMHDGIAALAYGSTRLGVKYLPPAAGLVAGACTDPAGRSAHDGRRGRLVLGAINGFWCPVQLKVAFADPLVAGFRRVEADRKLGIVQFNPAYSAMLAGSL